MAQRGEITSACDIFGQVRENVSEYPDVWLNIANIQLDMGQYIQSAQMYQSFMHRFQAGNRFDINLYIAFAYYKAGQFQQSLDFIAKVNY